MHIKPKGVDGNADDIKSRYKKYIPKVFAAVLIATALLLVMNVRYYQKYADFVPVDAMITDVQQHVTSSLSSDNKMSYTTYVTYQYKYGSSSNVSKTYTATRIEFFKFGKEKGKKVVVKINSESPDEIENTYGRNACRMLTAFCFAIDAFLWMAIRQIKQEKENGNWS